MKSFPNDESFRIYRREISNLPVLTHEEVIKCGRLALGGDIDARRLLILSHLKFVVDIASQHLGGGLPLSELVCWGNLGLLDAVEGYDPDYKKDPEAEEDPENPEDKKDARSPGLFTTYAKWYIEKYIKEAKKAWTGRLTKKDLEAEDDRPDIYEKMAGYLSVDLNAKHRRKNRDDIIEPFAWLDEVLLDSPAYSEDRDGATKESLIASDSPDPAVYLADEDSKMKLNQILAETLSDEEKMYIMDYFGFEGKDPLFQWEIAKKYYVDPRDVAKTINKVIMRLNKDRRIRELRGSISH